LGEFFILILVPNGRGFAVLSGEPGQQAFICSTPFSEIIFQNLVKTLTSLIYLNLKGGLGFFGPGLGGATIVSRR
jgi:hypothetical protein